MPERGRPKLVVGIPTYRRTSDLARLLAALPAAIERLREVDLVGDVDVVVVENDPAQSARDVAGAAQLPVRYVVEAERGVVAVRNRALDEAADADLLVFIDDDESPADDRWLVHLAQTQSRSSAAAVAGPVRTVSEEPLDPWIVSGGFFARAHRAQITTGTRITRAATNNLLLDMAFVRSRSLRFDQRFARSGGEDSLFTSQLHASGGVIVWCAEAIVLDHLPPERRTREHALRRTRGMASAGVRVGLAFSATGLGRARVRGRAAVASAAHWIGGATRAAGGVLLRSEHLDAVGRQIGRAHV